ncbi:MAG: hypothetical protein U0U67_11260 [Chitinophagales bacterium]
MKKISLILALLCTTIIGFSQEIDIKKGIVFIDGKECLKVNSDPNNVAFSDLQGNEIIFLKFIHDSKYASLYVKVTFLDQKISFTSKSYIFTKKLLIKKLLEDGTLTDCKIVSEKAERFVLKYDEAVDKD